MSRRRVTACSDLYARDRPVVAEEKGREDLDLVVRTFLQ